MPVNGINDLGKHWDLRVQAPQAYSSTFSLYYITYRDLSKKDDGVSSNSDVGYSVNAISETYTTENGETVQSVQTDLIHTAANNYFKWSDTMTLTWTKDGEEQNCKLHIVPYCDLENPTHLTVSTMNGNKMEGCPLAQVDENTYRTRTVQGRTTNINLILTMERLKATINGTEFDKGAGFPVDTSEIGTKTYTLVVSDTGEQAETRSYDIVIDTISEEDDFIPRLDTKKTTNGGSNKPYIIQTADQAELKMVLDEAQAQKVQAAGGTTTYSWQVGGLEVSTSDSYTIETKYKFLIVQVKCFITNTVDGVEWTKQFFINVKNSVPGAIDYTPTVIVTNTGTEEYTVGHPAGKLEATVVRDANTPGGSLLRYQWYIQAITPKDGTELAEFTNGKLSGWMYTLNGKHSDLGVAQQYLMNGDVIVFHYTDDYSRENAFDQQKSADEVITMIAAIGTVSLSKGAAISQARTAYDKLSADEKALVTNYDKLLAAEAAYAKLVAEMGKKLDEIYKTTGDFMGTLGTPTVNSTGGEWMVIGLARSGRTVPAGYYDNVVEYVKAKADANERLHPAKVTDNARVILALTAIGKDVTNVGGHNLLKGLDNMAYVQTQGINGPIFTLIALDSHNYPTMGDVTREKLIQVILDAQLSNGGWNLSGNDADPDMTAMAIQALAPYYKTNETVKAAVDKALEALSALQRNDGGFGSWGTVNSESCAQVIVALTALGIDPTADSRFVKNDLTVLDALASFYVTGGGFKHVADKGRDGMATEQGYYALAAYYRFINGQTRLYDMSDVTIQTGGSNTPATGDTGVLVWVIALPVTILAAAFILKRKEREA